MKISKNIHLGGIIEDLNELVRLAKDKKSVVVYYTPNLCSIRPAAFIIQWSIAMIINHKIHYAIHERDITPIEFEEGL